jgi:mRNA interferase RelE/StbE
MTQIAFTPAAAKQLRKLPRQVAQAILAKLDQLAADPQSLATQVKALQNSDPKLYRLRVGDYRVVYAQEGDTLRVAKVAHRREVYR